MIAITVPQDDLSVTVPEEKTEYTTWYGAHRLLTHTGAELKDDTGAFLTTPFSAIENVYVLNVQPDNLSVSIPEES